MADLDFEDFENGYAYPQAGFRTGRMVHLAGAVCSVALVIGLAVWGYKLAVRDVAGIPVIRALEGPLRISPENPGGIVAAHSGLSVNAVAAVGTAMPLPETLSLAPQAIELAPEDVAGLAAPVVDVAAEPAHDDISARLAATALPEAGLSADQNDAVAAALAAALSGEDVAVDPALQDETDLALLEGADAGGMVKSLRPPARPSSISLSSSDGVADPAAPVLASIVELSADQVASGDRLVQLGAFDDEAAARAEWAKLQERFGELVSAKSLVVQTAQSGGRDFFRLRAHGFGDEDEARRFCAALLAENASCIPVVQR